jgi:hypothetical protein
VFVTVKVAPLQLALLAKVTVTDPLVSESLKVPSVQVCPAVMLEIVPPLALVTEPSPFAEKYSPISNAPLLAAGIGLVSPLV